MSKVVVVGAGASGIIAALKASEKNKVIIVEKNDKIGKKLLLTGNGRCNYWHDNISINNYETDDTNNLDVILSNLQEVYNYLYSIGIYPKIKDGYYYPYSNASFSIVELFKNELKRKKIEIFYDFNVIDILKKDNKFEIISKSKTISCDRVIISTGSKAYYKTGSDGFAYDYLKKYNFIINPVLPSLVALKSNNRYLKDWNGLRLDAKLSLYINNCFIQDEIGEVQLTDYGISGICTFNLSSKVAKALYLKKDVKIYLNFMPFLNESFYDFFSKRSKIINKTIYELLETIFNYKLINIILAKSNISKNAYFNSLTEKEIKDLSFNIEKFEVNIIDTNGFDKAQTCVGGISLKEINPLTMECMKIDNLFLTGELLDVNGICGGYNLALAFITGFIAGKSV